MPIGRYFWPLGAVAAVALTLRWRWLRTPGRILVIGTMSMLGAVAWVSGEHRLTPSTRLLISPMLWVMLAAASLIPARGWTSKAARWTAAVVLAGLTAQMVHDRLTYKRNHPSPSDQIVNFIESVPERFPHPRGSILQLVSPHHREVPDRARPVRHRRTRRRVLQYTVHQRRWTTLDGRPEGGLRSRLDPGTETVQDPASSTARMHDRTGRPRAPALRRMRRPVHPSRGRLRGDQPVRFRRKKPDEIVPLNGHNQRC